MKEKIYFDTIVLITIDILYKIDNDRKIRLITTMLPISHEIFVCIITDIGICNRYISHNPSSLLFYVIQCLTDINCM